MTRHGVLVVLLLFSAACSSDDSDEKGTPVELDGLIHQIVLDEENKVVPGVEICVVQRKDIPCVTTDDLGVGDLPVPKNAELVVSYEKTDFVTKHRSLLSDESLETGLNTWFLQRKVWYDAIAAGIGGTIDYSLGAVGLQTVPVDGVSFELEPKPASVKGPIQFALVGGKLVPCPASGTTCEFGVGAFFDMPPGKYKATFNAPGKTCTPKAFACAGGAPGCMELDVVAGVVSNGYVPCE